ncbi:MAG: tRNA pseudouridine(38-40) synthase TruA [Blastocatellia bacterium AA13]|nr:MAG: tRNA pseudouridine(38-40) synthase TruA [Blastocatellia bacterium AA13]
MRNTRLILEYDGTDFNGWQIQPNGRTIQAELTKALTRIDGKPVTVHAAGRTDAGVHALGQVASARLETGLNERILRDAINANIDRDVRVRCVEFVEDWFHPRVHAKQKTYRYQIWNADVVSPFLRRYVHQHRAPLNLDLMREGGAFLIGKHDFIGFTVKATDVETTVRTIARVDVEREGSIVSVTVAANGFLRYMVRAIAGTLIEVGRGHRPPEIIAKTIERGDRSLAGPTAPALGLTLMQVDY